MATAEEIKQQYANYNTDRIGAVNSMYDAQKQSQLSQLENAYNQSKSAQQAAKDQISPTYQQKANDLAVQYERNRRNFNQQAAGNGINTGTASQAALAQNSMYQRDYGELRGAEADALTAADRGLADLETAYQNNIRAAAAENDYKRAAALLDEYKNQYSRDLQRAQTLASFGDFSGYSTIYGDTEANNMFNAWKASNPDLAYRTGSISADEYYRMTGKYPAGYSAPSSGGGGWYGGGSGGSTGGTGGLSDLNKKPKSALDTSGIDRRMVSSIGTSIYNAKTPEQLVKAQNNAEKYVNSMSDAQFNAYEKALAAARAKFK